MKLKQKDGAMHDLNIAIKLDSNDAMTYSNRGYLNYDQLVNFDAAGADYSRAIRIDSGNISAYVNRSICFTTIGKNQLAVDDLESWIKLDSTHAPFYNMKGIELLEVGKVVEACMAFKKALDLGESEMHEVYKSLCDSK